SKATLTDNNTVAIVTGSVVCGPGDTFEINSVVQQNHAQTNVAGSGFSEPVDCTGSPQPFAVPLQSVTPPNATFHNGPARATLAPSASNRPALRSDTSHSRAW